MADEKEPPPLFDNVEINKNDDIEEDDDDLFASAVQVKRDKRFKKMLNNLSIVFQHSLIPRHSTASSLSQYYSSIYLYLWSFKSIPRSSKNHSINRKIRIFSSY